MRPYVPNSYVVWSSNHPLPYLTFPKDTAQQLLGDAEVDTQHWRTKYEMQNDQHRSHTLALDSEIRYLQAENVSLLMDIRSPRC